MDMLLACVLCTVCVSGIWQKGIRSPGTADPDNCVSVCGCWDSNPGPLGHLSSPIWLFSKWRVWESFLTIFLIRGCVLNQFGDLFPPFHLFTPVLQNMTLVFCDFSTWWPTLLLHAVLLRRSEIFVLRVGIAGKRCMPLLSVAKRKAWCQLFLLSFFSSALLELVIVSYDELRQIILQHSAVNFLTVTKYFEKYLA